MSSDLLIPKFSQQYSITPASPNPTYPHPAPARDRQLADDKAPPNNDVMTAAGDIYRSGAGNDTLRVARGPRVRGRAATNLAPATRRPLIYAHELQCLGGRGARE